MQKKEVGGTQKAKNKQKEKKNEEIIVNKKPDIMEPVLNDNGGPYWLTRRYEKITPRDNRSVEEILKDSTSYEELPDKPIFELKPSGLWQCQKCGANIESHPDQPLQCYKEQGGCGRDFNKTNFLRLKKEFVENPKMFKDNEES